MSEAISKVTGYECRFATFVQAPEYNAPDLHVVKVIKHNSDGTTQPEVKLIRNFERPFWTVKKGQQNFKQHKEWLEKDKLIEGKSTQSKLVQSISKSLGMGWFKGNLRRLCASPYVFGADILSTAIIKKTYTDKYPDLQTPYSVAVCDVETDVINGTKDIIIVSITYKNTVFSAVTKDFVGTMSNVESKFEETMYKYLGDIIKERDIKFKLVVVDNAALAVAEVLKVAHNLKPDFLAFWNMDFDISRIMEACEKYNVDPKDIFSDPIVPKEYRLFKYKQGPKKKVTASGKVTPIKPAAQWHTVYSTSSFYVIDAMCVYKHVRIGKPEEQSYSLDNILNANLGIRKLKFEEASHVSGLKWHELMQSKFKVEYMVYNVFDCVSIELLDEKTYDLSLTFPLFSGFSDFENFKSQPRRAVDNLHYFALENDRVISATAGKSNDKEDEDDEETSLSEDGEVLDPDQDNSTLSLNGWICTLPAHLVVDNGLKCIEEYPDLTTNCRAWVGD